MKKNRLFYRRTRNVLLVVLLAAACVGGCELLAVHYYDPDLYQELTQPARSAWQGTKRAAVDAADSLTEMSEQVADQVETAWEDYQAQKAAKKAAEEEARRLAELEAQVSSEPEVVETAPVQDPTITEIRSEGEQEILSGGVFDIVYFNQRDEVWASQPYGRDTIGPYGCGPVAMAMAVSSMTDEVVNPADMAQFAAKHGYWASHSGSYLTIVSGTASAYGLECESFTGRTVEELYDAILSNHVLVALMGPGHFTRSGHFILLRGVTLDGMILVADPSDRERSLTLWEPQLILDELSASTSAGGPLWALSLPSGQPQPEEGEPNG
jgi:hypothetical protein